ncbi:hypothetical protein KY290_000822 [Solanum tuberosum]|uniref:Uncharacterized protein n=1 Tax=Solanum tuberosum TaxID=4113 RepID=A0ABQ7WKE4_SOLTU|nr:hypothetical protein KY284_003678 [Solanum tuberosum]KAH0727817.1 hypothetical protein KY284_003682 [Solanum tuberosum]KAH0729783.1 hypothetical protein KY289_000971 [Solanum tuberosum]KAH0729788.1 hypothetical protein KY289_000976 [Solanum tuberosum]KAH0729793.1 hypothetical protein KY289_000981 [Solanum tuberosum]
MDAIIPALTHRIPSELRKTTSIGLTGDGGVGRMGVTGGVMRRCAWRLGRWGGRLGRWEEGETTSLGLTGDGGVGRMGVTGGVMRRCAWRLGRWGAG